MKRPDIWHHLKDHETVPPAELREHLLVTLDTLADNHAAESGALETRTAFQRLLDHFISPPSAVSSAIAAEVRTVSRTASLNRPGIKPRKLLPYAAACILLIIAGIVLYTTHNTEKPAPIIQKPSTVSITPASITPASADTTHTTHTTRIATRNTPARSPQLSLVVEGRQLPLVDNNILATFTDYKYPALKDYVDDSVDDYVDAGIRIHLDQYTDITLSPVMTAALKTLYAAKPDGSPARKARKTKEKLAKWAAEDNKRFDPHTGSNPLDPIDLAEFIFPPLFSFGWHWHPAATPDTHATYPEKAEKTNTPVTVSYRLTLVTKKANNNIAETYNGAAETLFADGDHARLRLASLMRIQSLFLEARPQTPDRQAVTMLAESTKPQLRTVLTAGQWQTYNAKYAGAAARPTTDTTSILGYACKKALIGLRDGRRITVWYTPLIEEPAQSILEPEFAAIPGLVLRYEYTCRRKTVCYTATTLSRRPIDPSVFNITSTP